MVQIERDESRENRIDMEAIVDTYNNKEERAMGWYYYLDDKLQFPFPAKWTSRQHPEGTDVEVIEMSPEDDCSHDMFVEVQYHEGSSKDIFPARLSEIHPIDVDEKMAEAIADWHYWIGRGYEF